MFIFSILSEWILVSDYYYIIESNDRQAVVATADYVNSLKQQYYYREPNGYLTKVVGDTNYSYLSVSVGFGF